MHLVRWFSRHTSVLTLAVSVFVALPVSAVAHVKWFCGPVDVTAPPLNPTAVLSPLFLSRGFAFLMLVSAGGLFDTLASRRWPGSLWRGRCAEIAEDIVVRLGVGAYMFYLWNKSAVAPWDADGDGTILTPELFNRNHWLGLLQLVIASMLVLRWTWPLAALGIVALYAVGITRYGLFHMTDYAYFLGVAGYLGLSSPPFSRRPTLRRWRVPVIAGSLSFSLMWTAIEKFLYPAWTEIVLASHPDLTLGFSLSFVTITAGFVEFSLAFYLLVGRSLVRIDAIILLAVFLAAIPEFGVLDSVGHLPIVAILLVVLIHGTTRPPEPAPSLFAGLIKVGASISGLYLVTFLVMMAMYYGLQRTGAWL